MNHKYEKETIPDGQDSIEQACLNCGARRVKYASGAKGYFMENGSKTPHSTKCIAGAVVIKLSRVNDDELKARLTEALVFIRLMFEDMIKGNFNCKSRQIAGTFLYSQGYKTWCEEISKNIVKPELINKGEFTKPMEAAY